MKDSIWTYNGKVLNPPAKSIEEAAIHADGFVPFGVFQTVGPDAAGVLRSERHENRVTGGEVLAGQEMWVNNPPRFFEKFKRAIANGEAAAVKAQVEQYAKTLAVNPQFGQDAYSAILDKMLPTVGRYTSGYATLSAEKCAETMAKMEAVLERQATARRGEEIMRAVRLASGDK